MPPTRSAPAEASAASSLRDRDQIAERFKWNLSNIFPDWDAWQAAYDDLDRQIAAFAALQGTLAQGGDPVLTALKRRDEIGQLEYKVWYYASLWHDQDQRDNQINAKRQQVQILFAKAAQAAAWFDPELLKIPTAQPEVRGDHGQRRVLTHVRAGLSFVRPEQLRFRYKLEGLDQDWVEAGTRRTAYYSHVPPGTYAFRVMAANSDGVPLLFPSLPYTPK